MKRLAGDALRTGAHQHVHGILPLQAVDRPPAAETVFPVRPSARRPVRPQEVAEVVLPTDDARGPPLADQHGAAASISKRGCGASAGSDPPLGGVELRGLAPRIVMREVPADRTSCGPTRPIPTPSVVRPHARGSNQTSRPRRRCGRRDAALMNDLKRPESSPRRRECSCERRAGPRFVLRPSRSRSDRPKVPRAPRRAVVVWLRWRVIP
jgi:hypothetical protein